MKGKILSQEAIVTTPKEWSSVNVVIDADGKEIKGNVFLGKNKTTTGLTDGQEVEFELTTDNYGNKIKIAQPQGQGNKSYGGGGGGFKPSEQQWIAMQRSIAAQSAAHTAFEYAKGNEKVNSDQAITLAGKIFDFVISKSEMK